MCRTVARCPDANGSPAWSIRPPSLTANGTRCDDVPLPPSCPKDPPLTAGPCSPDGSASAAVECLYPDGTVCACVEPCCQALSCDASHCPPGVDPRGPMTWRCQLPSTVPGCNPVPNEGAPCDLPSGTHCIETLPSYGNCPLDAVCSQGAWSWSQGHLCPVCAAPDTPIATPSGERPIASLAVGDLVYSVDHGVLTVAPLVRVNRTPVSGHHVVHTILASGTVLDISPGHPTTDGRTFAGLHSGDLLDGVEIRSATLVPYTHDATYDILPDTDSGAYFAGGVLVGSTLATHAAPVTEPTAAVESMAMVEGARESK